MERQFAFSEEQASRQYQYDMEAMALQRQWDLEDRQFAVDNPIKVVNEIDIQKMVREAEAAGFNPLTLLRNGGGAGFSTSSQPSAPLSRQAPTRQAALRHAALRHAPMAGVANEQSVGAAAIGGFLDNFDPFQDTKRELEYRLVEAQIANLNAGTAAYATRPGTFNIPAATARTVERRGSGAAAQLGAVAVPDPGEVTVTNPWDTMLVNPRQRDAAAYEERYGDSELFQTIIGGGIFVRDLIHNRRAKEARRTNGGGGW